jgi:hypothetical protein
VHIAHALYNLDALSEAQNEGTNHYVIIFGLMNLTKKESTDISVNLPPPWQGRLFQKRWWSCWLQNHVTERRIPGGHMVQFVSF